MIHQVRSALGPHLTELAKTLSNICMLSAIGIGLRITCSDLRAAWTRLGSPTEIDSGERI